MYLTSLKWCSIEGKTICKLLGTAWGVIAFPTGVFGRLYGVCPALCLCFTDALPRLCYYFTGSLPMLCLAFATACPCCMAGLSMLAHLRHHAMPERAACCWLLAGCWMVRPDAAGSVSLACPIRYGCWLDGTA